MSSLYCAHFRLEETPFSVAPDPCFLFMSAHHREALGHLLYGLGEGGGFVQLTGEVGTGKTTICRTLLSQLPENVDVALIFNPKLTVTELLQTICEELHIEAAGDDGSTKASVDRLYAHLLDAHAKGRRTILIIDEAQNLSSEVLEQIRLLTNLETNESKLLQIFLIGQPELRRLLGRDDLRQLAQRITARYHLESLSRAETEQYIRHRLSVAGCERRLFNAAALRQIYQLTGGIPRLINSLCDRALLGAFVSDRDEVDARIVRRAHRELRGEPAARIPIAMRYAALGVAVAATVIAGIFVVNPGQGLLPDPTARSRLAAANADAEHAVVERGRPQSAPNATSTAPGTGEAAPSTDVAAFTPEGDANAAPVPAASPAIGPAEHAPALQGRTERLAHNDASGPNATAPPARADRYQSAASARLTLGEHLDSVGDHSSLAAEQRLFALWGLSTTPADGELCAQAADHGLVCFSKSGSWDKLRGFDLPAFLTLRREGFAPVRALLIGLVGRDATLYLGGQQHTYRLHEVDRYWDGQFTLLWRPPLERVTVIRPSHHGASVQWLRTFFARVDGAESAVGDDAALEAALAERIKNFQRRRGLYADGIAGPETLIHLSRVTRDSTIPTLSAASVSAAQGVTPAVAYFRD